MLECRGSAERLTTQHGHVSISLLATKIKRSRQIFNTWFFASFVAVAYAAIVAAAMFSGQPEETVALLLREGVGIAVGVVVGVPLIFEFVAWLFSEK